MTFLFTGGDFAHAHAHAHVMPIQEKKPLAANGNEQAPDQTTQYGSSLFDLIQLPKLSKPPCTTAAPTFSPSVPQGVKPSRRYSPQEVLDRNRAQRDWLVDMLSTAIAEAKWEGVGIYKIEPRLPGWVERMQKCADGAYVSDDAKTGRKTIRNFRSCRVRLCPICTWRAALRNACRYSLRTEAFIAKHPTTYCGS